MTTDPITLADIPAKYAQPDPSTVSKLPKPTKKDNPKGKCDVCGGWHGLPAVHLDYQGHAEITLSLLAIDPLWSWEPSGINPETGGPMIQLEGDRLVMWGYLTVLGARRLGVGTCEISKPEPEKELIGDLLRNCAMRFGIATKLWSKADSADPAGSAPGGGYERFKRVPRQPAPDDQNGHETGTDPPLVVALSERTGKSIGSIVFEARKMAKVNGWPEPKSARDIGEKLLDLVATRLSA